MAWTIIHSKYPANAKNASAVMLIWKNVWILLGLLSQGFSIAPYPVFRINCFSATLMIGGGGAAASFELKKVRSLISSIMRLCMPSLWCSLGESNLLWIKSFSDFLTFSNFSIGSSLKFCKSFSRKLVGFVDRLLLAWWLEKLFSLPAIATACQKFTKTMNLKWVFMLIVMKFTSQLHNFSDNEKLNDRFS